MRHLVLVVSGVLARSARGGSDSPTTAEAPSTTDGSAVVTAASVEAPNGVTDFGEFSQDHVDENVEYEQDPPVGGAHFRAWQTCDFYEAPIPNEQGVHSMEHGAVWITFAPDLADDERAAIEAFADGTREVLASPYEGLPSPAVASAWVCRRSSTRRSTRISPSSSTSTRTARKRPRWGQWS